MPRNIRIWRTVRVPLFFIVLISLLGTVALVTRGVVVAKNIAGAIDEAQHTEAKGTVEHLMAATKTLSDLAARYPRSEEAQAAWAWQAVLNAILLGPETDMVLKATQALKSADDIDTEAAMAARTGMAYLNGRYEQAQTLAAKGLAEHPKSSRLAMMSVLALNAASKTDEAEEKLRAGLHARGDYIPLFIVGVLTEIENEKRIEALTLAGTLHKKSPGHLYSALLNVKLELPSWGDPDPKPEEVARAKQQLGIQFSRLASAPPKLMVLGQYLTGRISLLEGDIDGAVKAFEEYAKLGPVTSDGLAWHAAALRKSIGGAEQALALLDKYSDITGKQVLDIRAQCLLDLHRVNAANEVIEQLAAIGALPHRVRELRWILAVRSGNAAAAKTRMPKRIDAGNQWLAVEMYFLLKNAGDIEGIAALTSSMESALPSCSKLIKTWHSRYLRRAISLMTKTENREPCDYAFKPRLLRNQTDATAVKEAAEQASTESGGSLSFEVDRALALWNVDGYDRALSLLEGVQKHHPEGEPLRAQLARAYIEMEQPAKALEVLGESEAPALLFLRVQASRMAGQDKQADALEAKAIEKNTQSPHPAYAYFALKASLAAGDATAVQSWVEDHMSESLPGEWTSELAELGALALIQIDEKNEAEKFLQATAKRVIPYAGTDQYLETLLTQIRINIKRVGKYRNRALTLARILQMEVKKPWLCYWLADDNIVGGSEKLGLRQLTDAVIISPSFKPAYEKMIEMDWLNDERTAIMKKMLPQLKTE